jgi:hypothetical protein
MLKAVLVVLIAAMVVFVIVHARRRSKKRERALLVAKVRARHEREWNEKIGAQDSGAAAVHSDYRTHAQGNPDASTKTL